MSELMDEAVIRMPFDMAMESELSRKQFYDRANALLSELTELRAKLAAMESQEDLRYTSDGALAECPCCGSLDVGGAHDKAYCLNCGLSVTRPRPLQNAIDAWNTRTRIAKPVPADKPVRITAQDAREIALSAITCARTDVSSWLRFLDEWVSGGDLRDLLNKLNADRQVPEVAVPDAATPEMEAAAEKYWNERRLKGLSDDPRTWAGVYAAMLEAAPSHSRQSAETVPAEAYAQAAAAINSIYGASQHCDCLSFEIAHQWRNETHGGTIYDRCPSHNSEQGGE